MEKGGVQTEKSAETEGKNVVQTEGPTLQITLLYSLYSPSRGTIGQTDLNSHRSLSLLSCTILGNFLDFFELKFSTFVELRGFLCRLDENIHIK